jgi:hypothetical protein
MKRLIFGILFALLASPAASAQSLNDQSVLSLDTIFTQRVRTSMISAAINISSDGLSTGINLKRHAQVQQIMINPDGWKSLFSAAIATQPTVIGPATASGTVVLTPMVTTCSGSPQVCNTTGNVDTQQALVTDTVINTAVASVFNSFFGGQ